MRAPRELARSVMQRSTHVKGNMKDTKENEGKLRRHSCPKRLPICLAEIEMCVKLPPRLSLSSNIKDPTTMSEVVEVPSTDRNDNVKDTRYQEEIGWEDELMMEEVGYHSQENS